jgi:hypothetical protein
MGSIQHSIFVIRCYNYRPDARPPPSGFAGVLLFAKEEKYSLIE